MKCLSVCRLCKRVLTYIIQYLGTQNIIMVITSSTPRWSFHSYNSLQPTPRTVLNLAIQLVYHCHQSVPLWRPKKTLLNRWPAYFPFLHTFCLFLDLPYDIAIYSYLTSSWKTHQVLFGTVLVHLFIFSFFFNSIPRFYSFQTAFKENDTLTIVSAGALILDSSLLLYYT